MYQYIAVIFGLISPAYAPLVLKSLTSNLTIEIEDAEASFGAEITDNLSSGKISPADPSSACSVIAGPPDKGVFFALADRGSCDFVEKVLTMQNANYLGAIVVNTESDYIFPMGSAKDANITIPAVMIGRTSGKRIRNSYLYNNSFVAQMKPNSATAIEYYLVPLLITLSIAFLAIIIFLAVRFLRNCLRQSKNRLSRDILNKLPEIRFSEDYQSLYETCAICLEDYAMGDKLRVLPCHHAYHSKCVDRWLLRRQRSCPVCKYRIHRNHDEPGSDVEDRHTGEGTSGTLEQAEQDEMSVADTPAASTSRSGLARPASLGYGDIDGDDVAPLLGKSAPAASWLSGGQLPSEGTTWLGYDNPAIEVDDDDEVIHQSSPKSPVLEKGVVGQVERQFQSDQVPDVSFLDPSSIDHQLLPSPQPRTEVAIEMPLEGDPEDEGKEGSKNCQYSSMVDV